MKKILFLLVILPFLTAATANDTVITPKKNGGNVVIKSVTSGGVSSDSLTVGPTGASIRSGVVIKTSSYSITDSDTLGYVVMDTSGGLVNITLPAPASNIGRQFTFEHKSGDANNACLLFNNSLDTVDGNTYAANFCLNDGDKITLVALAANQWKTVSYLYGSGDGQKNYVINGNFDFWQRLGSSGVLSASGYSADRWYFTRTASQNVSSYIGGDSTGLAEVVANIFTLSSSTYASLSNTLEFSDTVLLRGKTVTVSAYSTTNTSSSYVSKIQLVYKTSAADTARIDGGTVLCDSGDVTLSLSSWKRLSCTAQVPVTATNVGLILFVKGADSAASAFFKGAMLQVGPLLSPFVTAGRSKAAEFALVQRYYEKSFPVWTAPAHNLGAAYDRLHPCSQGGFGNNCYLTVPFQVTKRTAPSTSYINFYDCRASAASSKVRYFSAAGSGTVANSYVFNSVSDSSFTFNASDPAIGTGSVGVMLDFQWTADAEIAP